MLKLSTAQQALLRTLTFFSIPVPSGNGSSEPSLHPRVVSLSVMSLTAQANCNTTVNIQLIEDNQIALFLGGPSSQNYTTVLIREYQPPASTPVASADVIISDLDQQSRVRQLTVSLEEWLEGDGLLVSVCPPRAGGEGTPSVCHLM